MMMFDEVLKLYSGHGILQEDEAEEEWRDTIFGCNEVVALKFSRCAPSIQYILKLQSCSRTISRSNYEIQSGCRENELMQLVLT